jgi:ferritin-like metal-binding protein YciE
MDSARKNLENIEVNFENVRPSRHKFDGQSGLREMLYNELKSVYYLEKTLLKSFPKLIKNSCSFELIEAITIHQEETKLQIIRLEDSFALLNENPVLERCMAIEALIGNIDLNIEDTKFGMVRDAAIVMGMHQIEHYEISVYTILATYAENLGEEEIAGLLCETINEEKVTSLRLSKMAQTIRFYTSGTL